MMIYLDIAKITRLTQGRAANEIAEDAGIALQTWRRMLRSGDCTEKTLYKLSKALGVPGHVLMDGRMVEVNVDRIKEIMRNYYLDWRYMAEETEEEKIKEMVESGQVPYRLADKIAAALDVIREAIVK